MIPPGGVPFNTFEALTLREQLFVYAQYADIGRVEFKFGPQTLRPQIRVVELHGGIGQRITDLSRAFSEAYNAPQIEGIRTFIIATPSNSRGEPVGFGPSRWVIHTTRAASP